MKFRVDVDQRLIAHAKRAERHGDGAIPARAKLQAACIAYRRVRVLLERRDVEPGKFAMSQKRCVGVRQAVRYVALEKVVKAVAAWQAGEDLLAQGFGDPGALQHRERFLSRRQRMSSRKLSDFAGARSGVTSPHPPDIVAIECRLTARTYP